VVRELAMIKIKANTDQRTEAFQLMEHFGARSVDLSDASMIVMVHGDSDKIDAMAKAFNKFDIIEVVRTGKVVMVRGEEHT
jgi:acetolactate synthase-1/3 small subunit